MIESIAEAAPATLGEDDDVPALSDAETDLAIGRMARILLSGPDVDPVQVDAVLAQLGDFVASTDSPRAFYETLQIDA
ncbi:MAG: hypothetical protein IID40_12820 [Planctomycetes bacterium]|nr:hypothetical protein [Planctomycetota bacterium]